jgi:predicted Zn-dependent protease
MQTKILLRIVPLTLTIFLVSACSKEARKARFIAEANKYFQAGNYDKARVSYLQVVQRDPQNALAFERIGTIWLDDWAPLRAGPFLVKANQLEPNNVQYGLRLARCYLAAGQFADAQKQALKILAQVPDNGDAIVALTEAARSKEDVEVAEEQLQKFPNKTGVSFHLASANLFRNRPPPT